MSLSARWSALPADCSEPDSRMKTGKVGLVEPSKQLSQATDRFASLLSVPFRHRSEFARGHPRRAGFGQHARRADWHIGASFAHELDSCATAMYEAIEAIRGCGGEFMHARKARF